LWGTASASNGVGEDAPKLARSVYRVAEVDDFRGARSAPTPLCKQSESSELQDDAGLADAALRGHFGHVGDLAEVSLERASDAGCDRLGAGAGELRLDRNGGEVDLWQRRDRQPGDGKDAGQRDPNSQQRGCDGAGNEWRRQVHWSASSLAV
jgi:hypothetical protein